MFKPFAKVVKKIDRMGEVAKILDEIDRQDVLIGIPEEKSSRNSQDVNNAELGYVLAHGVYRDQARTEINKNQQLGMTHSQAVEAYLMSTGDPLFKIPPRPFLEPAIDANKENIATQQGKVLKSALENKREQARAELVKLGLYGQRVVKDWFTNSENNWPPNAPSTIARKGSDRPMIDTGQLRNAITYVLRQR